MMRYAKTQAGLEALKDRSSAITLKQRAALVLCDPKRTREQLLFNLAAVGSNLEDIQSLIAAGFIVEVMDSQELAQFEAARQLAAVPPVERYRTAYPIATRLSSGLGLKGFKLTLALERASSYEELCSVATRLRSVLPREEYGELHRALYQ